MSARERILNKLSRQLVEQVSLPDVTGGEWIRFADPVEQFREMVELVGGSCTRIAAANELTSHLDRFEEWRQAKEIFSRVAEVPGNVDIDRIEDPHELASLDFVVYQAQFAVAENGAVWVTDESLKHRVAFFITQYLVLLVRADQIVHNMHEAYTRATVPQPGFGLFLSGPSKTADIEQSLVIGAHGCRQLQVFVL